MQPLFTIHAGEYLVGSHIEQHLRDPNGDKVNVWVPSKDTGIDLLVTDKTNKKTTSLQVKFSKDFLLTHGRLNTATSYSPAAGGRLTGKRSASPQRTIGCLCCTPTTKKDRKSTRLNSSHVRISYAVF